MKHNSVFFFNEFTVKNCIFYFLLFSNICNYTIWLGVFVGNDVFIWKKNYRDTLFCSFIAICAKCSMLNCLISLAQIRITVMTPCHIRSLYINVIIIMIMHHHEILNQAKDFNLANLKATQFALSILGSFAVSYFLKCIWSDFRIQLFSVTEAVTKKPSLLQTEHKTQH